MRNKKLLIGFFASLLILIAIEFLIYLNYGKLKNDILNISFIVTGDNLDTWENMIKGAESCALDKDCLVTFVNSTDESGANGQIELIKRQLSDSANYIVLCGTHYDEVDKFILDNKLRDKVYYLKNDVEYDLGVELGKYLLNNSNLNKAIMISSKTDENIINARKGIVDVLVEGGVSVQAIEFSINEDARKQRLKNIISNNDYDAIISMDEGALNSIVSNQESFLDSTHIYAVDNRPEAVYYLDSDVLTALAYRDDYSIGYIAVQEILTNKSFDELSKKVPLLYVVDKDLMYLDEYQKILFPFAK